MVFYNEIDKFAADWLRNLIKAGAIAEGIVDERDIRDIVPDELLGYTQCHFFAGIGVWSYALRQAGWPDARPVWTGSCPCQPFSQAGKRKGTADDRHLWPYWNWLIQQRKPVTIFGEQVASKGGLAWFDIVQSDLEIQGYTVGATDLCAAGFGAPHIRQRLWFVGDTDISGSKQRCKAAKTAGHRSAINTTSRVSRLADNEICGKGSRYREFRKSIRQKEQIGGHGISRTYWSNAEYIPCKDGRARPVEPGIFPLAYGAANRVGRLRGYGNAIVAPVAVEFIRAYMEYEQEMVK